MVQEVEPDDLAGWVTCSEYMKPIVWAGIYEGGEVVGYGCVSRLHGKVWAHDLKHWGTDRFAVIKLYRLMMRIAKERGVKQVMTDVSDEKMLSLYRALGWTPQSVILQGEL